jgi:signal transduction histidine kinase
MTDVSGDRRPHVLLVGGTAATRKRIREALDPIRVEEVPDARGALARAREQPPDLVLTATPAAQAVALLSLFRADAVARLVPVVLWGISAEQARVEAFEAGADDVLPRRQRPRELRARIGARLEADGARAEATRVESAARTEAEASNRAKDEFIAMISHELRTPLGAILIWTQLLRNEQLDEAATTRALGMIERSTKTLAQLIDDLLDVSRIVSGKLRMEPRSLDLRSVVEAGLEPVRPAAEASGVRIQVALGGEPVPVIGDSQRLQQVVWNLVSNAVKFTPDGGVVDVQLGRVENRAQLRVRDTGIGIGPDFLPHVFDRFRQATTGTTRAHGGLGLGLTIVRHLVEAHRGSVAAESEGIGLGACFTVVLPCTTDESAEEEQAAEDRFAGVSQEGSRLSGLKVLVVDDEEDVREMLRVTLEREGARVATAGSVSEAFAAFEEERPDVVVSDIAMPVADGYALMKSLRTRSPEEGGAVPALALTAYASPEDAARSRAAGFQVHLAKPIDPGRVVETIAGLGRRRPGAI